MDPGRGEEFDALYAEERKRRSEREESRQKRHKRSKQELKDVKRVDAESIRDVLRKRLKGEEIDNHYQRQHDKTNYRSDRNDSQRRIYDYKSHDGRKFQVMKNEAKKTGSLRAKLHEFSMSPRTRRKKELESLRAEPTQEVSSEDKGNLESFNKTFNASRRAERSLSEKPKTNTESMKESPGSWLFKSAKKRKKELLQQKLDLRQKIRPQEISSKRQQLTDNRRVTTNKLLKSPKRLDDISTARSIDILTAKTHASSDQILQNRNSHQTARSIVEEDLKQRLQQMDFKLTSAKIPKRRSESERSTTSESRSKDSATLTSSSDTLRSSRRHRKLSSNRRMRQRKSDKRSHTNKLKYLDKINPRLSKKQQKMDDGSNSYHSNSQKRVSNDSTFINNQKQSMEKSPKLEKRDSESEETEKISTQSKLKDKRMIMNRKKRGKDQLIKMDGLQRMKSKNRKNLKKALNRRLKKKIQNEKELFLKSEKKANKQLKKAKRSMTEHFSNISKSHKTKRNLGEESNQQSTKIFPPSSSLISSSSESKKSKKDQFDSKNYASSRQTTKIANNTPTDSKKSSAKRKKENLRNLQKSNQVSNAATCLDIKKASNREISMSTSLSGRNRVSTESKIHPNFANTSAKAITSNNILSKQKSVPQISEKKLDPSSFLKKSKTIEMCFAMKPVINEKMIKKFEKKFKKDKTKKSDPKKTKKSKSLEANLELKSHKSNRDDSSKNSKNKIKIGRKDSERSITSKTTSCSETLKGSKKNQIRQYPGKKDQTLNRINEKEVSSRQQIIGSDSAKENVKSDEAFAAIIGKYRNLK